MGTMDCVSLSAESDVTVLIEQATLKSGLFTARVVQSRPQALDLTFTHVGAGWSGHFFNFGDLSSQLPLKFHLLTRGGHEDIDNVEVYTDDDSFSSGPVNVSDLDCTLQRNH